VSLIYSMLGEVRSFSVVVVSAFQRLSTSPRGIE